MRTRDAGDASENGLAFALTDEEASRSGRTRVVEWSTEVDDGYEPTELRLERPICPRCFLELPKSRICGWC